MTLRTRIVAALILAVLIPMAVALAVPLVQAERRAGEETARRVEQARRQMVVLLDDARASLKASADRAARDLGAEPKTLTALLRGPEGPARAIAQDVATRYGIDHLDIVAEDGSVLASTSNDGSDQELAALAEKRRFLAGTETLELTARRDLDDSFTSRVAAITGGQAALGPAVALACPEPAVKLPVAGEFALCVRVTPADARDVRRDLLKSFEGVAPIAFLAALAVGLVLAGRIARPVRDLAERAESIAAQRLRPIVLLSEKDETRRMTLAFDQMLDALQASERQRLAAERVAAWEEIAKRLAHEIKNPLSPIQLAVENLRRTRERAPAEFDEAFLVETRTILEEVGALRALVDEFAQFARLPRPRVAACDPRAIVEQALALFAGRIEAMHATATVDGAGAPATIQADAEQVGRILKNVIGNALDAMEGAAERTLAVTLRGEDGRVAVAVRDTGRGFDAEALRRVFEPYFTTRADRGGTGLGMAIARRIAEEHGGSLRAEGAPSRGATITLILPIAGPPPGAA